MAQEIMNYDLVLAIVGCVCGLIIFLCGLILCFKSTLEHQIPVLILMSASGLVMVALCLNTIFEIKFKPSIYLKRIEIRISRE